MFGRGGSVLLVGFLFVVILGSCFVDVGDVVVWAVSERAQWVSWASIAWRFFQPGVAVDVDTGLCGAGLIHGWHYFTEWDFGTYIMAVLDAEKIGLLPRDGLWGSTDRLNRVMAFLRNREIAPNGVPYHWYDARTAAPARALSNGTTGVSDLGNLLIALHAVKVQRPEYAADVDYVVYTKMNLTGLASDPSAWSSNTAGVYRWYAAYGFKFFGFDVYAPVRDSLGLLGELLNGPQVVTYNVSLPVTEFTSEPLLLGALHLPYNADLMELAYRAYLAQENRFRATGRFTAFSEGNTNSNPDYVYEWIVTPGGETWTVLPGGGTPVVFLKVGFGFYALFRSQYALDVINHVFSAFSNYTSESGTIFRSGYYDGVDEAGRLVNSLVDKTNGMILASARYALVNSVVSLRRFPWPFVSDGLLNVTFVIGDTEPHAPLGWRAYTADLMGSLGVAGKLGQLSDGGDVSAVLDTSVAVWNAKSESVVINWSRIGASNVVSIGGPAVNLVTYYYERVAEKPFSLVWNGSVPCLYSNVTKESYSFSLGVTDYAVLYICRDSGRFVLVGWGLTHRGTIALCQFLQYFDGLYGGLLSDCALIIRWRDRNGDCEVDLGDEVSVVESWV